MDVINDKEGIQEHDQMDYVASAGEKLGKENSV